MIVFLLVVCKSTSTEYERSFYFPIRPNNYLGILVSPITSSPSQPSTSAACIDIFTLLYFYNIYLKTKKSCVLQKSSFESATHGLGAHYFEDDIFCYFICIIANKYRSPVVAASKEVDTPYDCKCRLIGMQFFCSLYPPPFAGKVATDCIMMLFGAISL